MRRWGAGGGVQEGGSKTIGWNYSVEVDALWRLVSGRDTLLNGVNGCLL